MGFSFLSDDMTIIKLPNESLCFPKPMTISLHTLRTATNVSNNALLDTKMMKLRSIIHSKGGRSFMHSLGKHNVPILTLNALGQRIIKPPKFKVEDLLLSVNFLKKTKINKLYILEENHSEQENIATNDEAVRKVTHNNNAAYQFPPYDQLIKHLRINDKDAEELLNDETVMLKKLLGGLKCNILKSEKKSWYKTISCLHRGSNEI